jgi:hypothetical protein
MMVSADALYSSEHWQLYGFSSSTVADCVRWDWAFMFLFFKREKYDSLTINQRNTGTKL